MAAATRALDTIEPTGRHLQLHRRSCVGPYRLTAHTLEQETSVYISLVYTLVFWMQIEALLAQNLHRRNSPGVG